MGLGTRPGIVLVLCLISVIDSYIQDLHENLLCVDVAYLSKLTTLLATIVDHDSKTKCVCVCVRLTLGACARVTVVVLCVSLSVCLLPC